MIGCHGRWALLLLVLTLHARGLAQVEGPFRAPALTTRFELQQIVANDERLAIRGFFDRVSRPAPGLLGLDRVTGERALDIPPMRGVVKRIIPHPSGGWVLFGRFDDPPTPSPKQFVRVFPNGQVDPNWVGPELDTYPPIQDVEAGPDGLWIVGRMQEPGGASVDQILRLSWATGGILPHSLPPITVESLFVYDTIRSLSIDGNTLYVAGGIRTVAGQPRHGFAAFDLTTGALLPWDPAFPPLATTFGRLIANAGLVEARDGWVLVMDADRRELRSTGDSGAFTSLKAVFGGSKGVNDVVINGRVAHVAGGFESVNECARGYLVAFDLPSGQLLPGFSTPCEQAVTSWASTVRGIEVDGTDMLVMTRYMEWPPFGALDVFMCDARTGQLKTSWSPGFDYGVGCAHFQDGQVLLIGGAIGTEAVALDGLALYSSEDARLDPVRVETTPGPGGTGQIDHMQVSENSLYLSGEFAQIDGVSRDHLAAIDIRTGAVLPWAPPLSWAATMDGPFILASDAGVLIDEPGNLELVHWVDPVTGALRWTIPFHAGGVRSCVSAPEGLYVAGSFAWISSPQSGRNLVLLDPSDGSLLPFPSPPGLPGWSIQSMALSSDTLYLAGRFADPATMASPPVILEVDRATRAFRPVTYHYPLRVYHVTDLRVVGAYLLGLAHTSVSGTVPMIWPRGGGEGQALGPACGSRGMVLSGRKLWTIEASSSAPAIEAWSSLLYRDFTLTPATVLDLGPGCPGSGSLTLLAEPPRIGDPCRLQVQGNPGCFGEIWMSLPPPQGPVVAGGCSIWLDPTGLLPLTPYLTDPSGWWSGDVLVPLSPDLDGVRYHLQGALLQGSGVICASNALEVTLGY